MQFNGVIEIYLRPTLDAMVTENLGFYIAQWNLVRSTSKGLDRHRARQIHVAYLVAPNNR